VDEANDELAAGRMIPDAINTPEQLERHLKATGGKVRHKSLEE